MLIDEKPKEDSKQGEGMKKSTPKEMTMKKIRI
jgi:hypothetical protein